MAPTLVIHGHFYQPPRENPWTEELSRQPSAAPFHDWNERVSAEAYRPNTLARIVDDQGRVVDIVNNFEHLSFDVGPTLLAWLERHDPDTYQRILAADGVTGGAMAQAYGHTILPLASERDARTQVRWGLADFAHRFGRPAAGMWLPEAAVNENVLAILVEEGVAFTVLAPHQAAVDEPVDTGRPWRWLHPDGSGRGLDVVFYDGAFSHLLAFAVGTLSSRELVDRAAAQEGLVTVAADGETFGHHHRWGERLLAHALAVEAPGRGVAVTNVARFLEQAPAAGTVKVRESSWSCAHGIGRWREDCGCSTGGRPGSNQRWRAPLRQSLDLVQAHVDLVFSRRGAAVLADPWEARDVYIGVILGVVTREEFAATHVTGDWVEAFTLLEAQRAAMAMYTSCGWFFHDLAGIETLQVLRYAARALDLMVELGEPSIEDTVLELLDKAESNDTEEGNGRQVWRRHVEPARVDANRAVSHLVLVSLLQRRAPGATVGAFDVTAVDHQRPDRGAVALCSGSVALTHRRTGRRSRHAFAALHLGGLEVVGFTRPADAERDTFALAVVRSAFEDGARVTTLLRLIGDGFGPGELDLSSALPDAADQIVEGTARALADRFVDSFEQLFSDHRDTIETIVAAGSPLPVELRAPAELALARRLEAALVAGDGAAARAAATQARASGVVVDTTRLQEVVGRLLLAAVDNALAGGPSRPALDLLALSSELGLRVSIDPAQDRLHAARAAAPASAASRTFDDLAAALNLAV